MMSVEQLVKCLSEETEILGENLSRSRFVHHKSHVSDQGSNLSRRGRKPATNCLNYDTDVSTSDCSAIANSRTLQSTTALTKYQSTSPFYGNDFQHCRSLMKIEVEVNL
jgi:hypothetical protein